MKIAFGSDMKSHVTDKVQALLEAAGHEVSAFGALGTGTTEWSAVGAAVGKAVASGEAEQGVLFCWTGTGISIAANKVRGIRAALCNDAETARGARLWNDANVLAMSLRKVTEALAEEILEAWFASDPSDDPEDQACLKTLREIEKEVY
jgi:ribose 5-phosphate isomerase B